MFGTTFWRFIGIALLVTGWIGGRNKETLFLPMPSLSNRRVLTVGPGQEFATLAAALAAAHDGDTLHVVAGTYINDFASIDAKVRIVGVGGKAHFICTKPIPNDKGIFIVNTDCTLENLEFSGAKGPSGNDAGIRWQGGNLTLEHCYFHDNQDGLLGQGGTLTIRNCEFAHNGAGDGFTHNLYVGNADSLVVQHSYFYAAVVGHNIKSRAQRTVITDSVIADGPDGTASFSVDLPNGGIARLQNNLIEKGPKAETGIIVAFGEEGHLKNPSSLIVQDNTILNDQTAHPPIAIRNASADPVQILENQFYGLTANEIASGPHVLKRNALLATSPYPATYWTLSLPSPWPVK
ncbi:Right handed beta helix region [Chthonomonas calidirosea]|uniref:Putative pectin lyase n=1 Tax=Chthonomonas calidirosea (strain DSM 23976 / ICMP 18418 / T49) TaxID=1303518 RepID=S0EUP5_CHTCT|nr:right-handed parallel beta-helix repeat-containing protein [Chthonomonas calidirosea]CCW35412.1 putative pectin lyase [Chthonomonas calidirosea T49]CEK20352.1 Right handed beta helix region [Chthonomonas calidirosea]